MSRRDHRSGKSDQSDGSALKDRFRARLAKQMTRIAGSFEGQPGQVDLSVCHFSCIATELPEGLGWLSPAESRTHSALRIEKRRRDWLLGRWTAKRAVAALRQLHRLASVDMQAIEILAAPDGAPQLLVRGDAPPWALSISHSSNRALCALVAAEVRLGCDIERIEPRSPAFVGDYFTASERRLVAAAKPDAPPLLANLIWSAKESALKARRTGLRADTRSVEVLLDSIDAPSEHWRPLRVVETRSGEEFAGWWRVLMGFVQTLAVQGGTAGEPLELQPS